MPDACDDGSDGSWLTYAQLAATRGISRRAAVRMTQRQCLRRQPGNDGKVRVWVPADLAELSPRASQRDDRDDDARDNNSLLASAVAALEDAVQVLREQLERAEAGRDGERQRAEAAERQAGQAEARADRAERRADRAEAREAELHGLLEQVQGEAREAHQRLQQLEAAGYAARRSASLLARLRDALRGR